MEFQQLKFYKVADDVVAPTYGTQDSACFDLSVHLPPGGSIKVYSDCAGVGSEPTIVPIADDGSLLIQPGYHYMIPTGIIFDIPKGYHVQIHLRSSTGIKKFLQFPNQIGIIDSDYVEQSHIPLVTNHASGVTIKNGERLAQAHLIKNIDTKLTEIPSKPGQKTDRAGGFGSTGS